MNSIRQMAMMFLGIMTAACAANAGPSDPDLIFRKSTTFKLLTPNDKLAVYGIDDPLVDGVVCHYTTPEKGGLSGRPWRGRADVRHFACMPAVRYDQVQGHVYPR